MILGIENRKFPLKVRFWQTLTLFDNNSQSVHMDEFTKSSGFTWIQLVFGPKLCFLWPSQLARRKVNIHCVLKSKIFGLWWPGFKDFIWFFAMEEHRPQKLTKMSFLIMNFSKFRKQMIFFCKNSSDFVP